MLNRVQLKAEAKALTKNAAVSAYVFTLIYFAIILVLQLIFEFAATVAEERIMLIMFLSFLVSLITTVLSAGYVIYTIGVRKGRTMPYTSLFDGFTFVGKIIILAILIYIFVFLWSLLLIIPGYIAIYRYRFAFYNLCENPQISALEALRMSKAQTRGHKWELFVLDLSFLGWNILCVLTLGILFIWITPYMQQTDIGYFEACKKANGNSNVSSSDDGVFRRDDRFNGNSSFNGSSRSYDPER